MEQSVLVSSYHDKIERPVAGAGFWIRAGARIIDTIVHNIVWFVAAFLIGVLIGIYGAITGTPTSHLFTGAESPSAMEFLLALVGSIFYHAISEFICGTSLGKLIFRIYVKNEGGQTISIGAAIIRSCAYFIDALFFGLVAYGNMKKSPLNQRLGDKWAKTVVVERSNLIQAQLPPWWKFLLAFVAAIVIDGFIAVLSTVLDLF